MDTYHPDCIKQKHQDDPIIQNIDIKPEPQTDSEVIIQTVDLKLEEVQQEPEVKKKRVQKRWSKKTILENRYEDEPQAVRIINITDVNAYNNKIKVPKPKRIPKRFKADGFDIQKVGKVITKSSELIKAPGTDAYDNIGYIKTEKELIIEDSLPEIEICTSGAASVSVSQNSNSKSSKSKKIRKKSLQIDQNGEFGHQKDYTSESEDLRNIKKHKAYPIDPESLQTISTELEDHPSTLDDQIYKNEAEFLSTIIKGDDQEVTTDPTYQNTTIDSDDSDSDNSDSCNSNYKFKDGKFTCIHCNMSFKLIKNFEKHECIICQHCKKVFTTRCALKRHILHIHTETDEIFECKDCNKTFKAKKYLETHIKSHEKIHECDNCGMKFGNTSRLNEHRIKHKNPEILVCKLCDRKCASRSSLKFHMRVHNVDRPKNLKCEKCSFTTDDNRTLVKHQKSHAKQEEKFKMSSEWLKCEKCTANLKNKQSLNNHMYYVHSEMSFQCNMCGIVVKTERNLRRHWQNIHEHENKN